MAEGRVKYRRFRGSTSDEEVQAFPRDYTSSLHRTPHRRDSYPFHSAPKVVLPRDIRQLNQAENIVEAYKVLVLLRDAIKESLLEFVTFLGLPADTELTRCFGHFRECAGRVAEIQIVEDEGEPKRMTLDEVSLKSLPKSFQHARIRFNSVLSNSFAFMSMKDILINDIKSNLEEMVGLSHDQLQTRATQNAYEQLRKIPSYIEDFTAEVERLLYDIDIAKYNLEKRGVTGFVQRH